MARAFAKVKGSVWQDNDWRQLLPVEQWAYVLLLSQPQINNCGVLPYVVTRWARLAHGLTVNAVDQLMRALDHAGFVVLDEETAEVLVRTFIKHDEVEKQPNLLIAAKRQYTEIQSPRIRHALVNAYPHIFEPIAGDAEAAAEYTEPLPEDLPEGVHEDLSEPLREGVNNGLDKPNPEGVPEGVSNPRARARKPPSPSLHPLDLNQQPAPNGSADAAAVHHLRQAGWTNSQLDEALKVEDGLQRAIAWLEHAQADHNVRRPGALAWTSYQAGGWPEAAPTTIAPGAVATRSVTKTHPHACEHCGSTFKSPERLAEHVDHVHTEHERTELPPEVAALVAGTTLKDVDTPKKPRKRQPRPEPQL